MNITQKFKYGVYEDGLATQLKSGYFNIQPNDANYPLLADDNGISKYKLYIKFPNERKKLLSEIFNILGLSLLFIIIIIVAFTTSLYQLIRQKKISAIKTDFINNMTHEFKTPIATINLALDAIKNPKIISEPEKIKRYVKMIREENKRMHGQVENVLRISRLEKNQIEITKDATDMHDTIEEAIEHIQLLVDDKKGTVTSHYQAISTEVLGNQFHLTNIIVNILENALKYSEGAPKIDIYTENTNKYFIFKVKDQGIGMSRNAQKYIFDKFYREHNGNIHNVKGHGLGLAYVKEIIDSHQGSVYVESEKGKGSLFTVKLPLI
ncbi:HAMP domain-containing sensor histidine kinase [Tenacibaculum dicentrarchi]|nr:HAMP domain-containing sensor histidine kinase [Tenacibaculum dicentrarchi]WBX69501.1 HAMP domain-containing sensor histidine kinase [Tenacibaculum dicentrarchi]